SYLPARWWSKATCGLFFIKVKVKGLEKIERGKSYVFAANHQSMFDIFVIYGWLPVRFKWIMKKELRKVPFVGLASEMAGHIFVDRSNAQAAKLSIEKAEKQLKKGNSIVIFPEGTRSTNGQMRKFKKGAFQIAADLALPIVPVTIKGSFERLSKTSFKVKPGVIEMIIHQPIDVTPYLPDRIPELMKTSWEMIHSVL
ncbi:MAG TPA: lysophospholipid acyltransferase family protein, partial [Paludibacteraceae bacterium]|nr:lysophospholipid acyltransferase family protein [Paludibacteraceae bacterium]